MRIFILRQFIFSVFILILIYSCSKKPKNFEQLLNNIKESTPEQYDQLISKYIMQQPKFPEIIDTTAYFLYKSQGHNDVYLFGDMCAWKPDSIKLNRIDGTDFCFVKQVFPANARIEYKFIENNQALLDPMNDLKDGGPLGKNSVLFMPEFKFSKYILAQRENATSKLDTIDFKSRILNNSRKILIYKRDTDDQINTLILFNDGPEYIQYANAQIILDNLIADGKIPEVYGVFIPPVDRMKEYWLNENYIRMIFTELIPHLKNTYHLDNSVDIGMGGASLGGVISLFALTKYKNQLDFVFSQSGALQISDSSIVDLMNKTNYRQTKICLQYGTFESMGKIHQELENVLQSKKVNYVMEKIPEGHNWGNWRGHLPEALIYCLNNGESTP
jgi:enterochelin esterase-like enzyme